MRRHLVMALAVVGLALTGTVATEAMLPGRAEAAQCIIPGPSSQVHYIHDPLNGHSACYRIFNQPVAGQPQLCWVTYYIQELNDISPGDATLVQLRTNDVGQGWVYRNNVTAKDSFNWVVKSGYHLANFSLNGGTQVCSDFSNPTSAQIRFTHPGNTGWKYVTVDWVN